MQAQECRSELLLTMELEVTIDIAFFTKMVTIVPTTEAEY